MAKLETINPTKVLETPKLRAKIGIAGMINPKPMATKKEMVVSTDTSRGSPAKGERSERIFIRSPLQLHLGGRRRAHGCLARASLLRRSQKQIRVRRRGMPS